MPRRIDPNSVNFLMADTARMFRAEFERRITLAQQRVTAAEARVLAHMARSGPERQNTLARRMGIGQMSLTGFLDRLEEAGLVERVIDPQDRRAKIARLTEAADPVLVAIASVGAEVRQMARGRMSDEDWARFHDLLARAAENLVEGRASDRAL